MSGEEKKDINKKVKEELGLIPPAFKIAEKH